ncbi:MAG: hypothetical protein V3T17_10070 [Pseudomonadales bacterium]
MDDLEDKSVGRSLNIETFKITNDILSLISNLDQFKGAWQAMGRIAPDRLSSLRHVATIESIGSSTRIEGVKLSDREIEQLLSNLETQSFNSRNEQEVGGYAAVMETVFSHWQDIPFTVNYIKQLHGELLQYSAKDVRHRGQHKTLSNSVEAFSPEGKSIGVIFETASPCDKHRALFEPTLQTGSLGSLSF